VQSATVMPPTRVGSKAMVPATAETVATSHPNPQIIRNAMGIVSSLQAIRSEDDISTA
jgi:hypothetical protein